VVVVAVPFVQVDPSQNPNLRAKGADHVRAYWDAMTVTFASIRRWNPEYELRLVSNQPAPEYTRALFEQLGVTTTIVPFDHRPPPGYAAMFAASLYLVDALQIAAEDETTVFIDPDVLCIRPLAPLVAAAGTTVGAILLATSQDEDINGLTLRASGRLHEQLGLARGDPRHYGGELYVVPGPLAKRLRALVEEAFVFSLQQHAAGAERFTTEEHLFNYALRVLGAADLSALAQRVWTAHRYRTVSGREAELALWHLPAEKDRGFATLRRLLEDPSTWFWTAPASVFAHRAGEVFGLHHRRPVRWTKDVAAQVAHSIFGR
jgi:hypothetical protein